MKPATLISLVALFFAVSGGIGYAADGLVTSAQIKDHTIELRDLAPATIRALRGQTGPQGPPGAAGADATFNPAQISRVIGANVVVEPSQLGSATVSCPAGETAIGGGGSGGIAGIDGSLPFVASGATTPTGWVVLTVNQQQVPVTIAAFVVCAAG